MGIRGARELGAPARIGFIRSAIDLNRNYGSKDLAILKTGANYFQRLDFHSLTTTSQCRKNAIKGTAERRKREKRGKRKRIKANADGTSNGCNSTLS